MEKIKTVTVITKTVEGAQSIATTSFCLITASFIELIAFINIVTSKKQN